MRESICRWHRVCLILGMSIGTLSLAWAHSNERLSKVEGAHGGMLRAAGQYHLELLVEEGQLRVWITDHANNPQTTRGAQGRAMVASRDRRLSVLLTPDGDNALAGRHPELRDGEDLRVALTVSMQGEAAVQARFSKAAQ